MNRSILADAFQSPCPAAGPVPMPLVFGTALRHLLIIKLSSLGDITQALPVATALRRQFPELRITWAVEDRFAALLHRHPAVNRVVTFPRLTWSTPDRGWLSALRRALRVLREEPYEVALDLQGLLKSSIVALWSRAPVRLGLSPQREGAALVSRALPSAPGRHHAVDHYLGCAAALGAGPAPVDFGLRVQPAAVASVARRLADRGVRFDAPLIAVNPSAARRSKAWLDHGWAAVIDGLDDAGTIVLVGGREQRRRHRRVGDLARHRPIDVTGATTLAELVALLDRSALHLAPDTGTLHIAAALGRPAIGVYGPTPPWRLGPYGQSSFAVHGAQTCAIGCPVVCVRGRPCMRAITPDQVLARARVALSGRERR